MSDPSQRLSIFERAQRYVSKMDPAISGSRGHDATFSVASALINGFSLGTEEALSILREYNLRCSPPWTESQLIHKVTSAQSSPSSLGQGYLLNGNEDRSSSSRPSSQPYTPPTPPSYDEDKLRSFAGDLAAEVNAAWLADRSIIEPSSCSADAFLKALYHPERGERVLIFLNEYSQGEAIWPDCMADKGLPREGKFGVWYLAQPVTGEYLPNQRSTPPGKASRRIAECVTAWRYLLLESDNAPARLWLGAVVQLPLPIAAIYTSGSRSVHVLVRVDCATKAQWDQTKARLLAGMVTLGACRGSLSGVRLTRLPTCLRLGKSVEVHDEKTKEKKMIYERYAVPGLQKLLYLNPDPSPRSIVSMVPLRNVVASLESSIPSLALKLDDLSVAQLQDHRVRFAHFSGQSPKCKTAAADLDDLISTRGESHE